MATHCLVRSRLGSSRLRGCLGLCCPTSGLHFCILVDEGRLDRRGVRQLSSTGSLTATLFVLQSFRAPATQSFYLSMHAAPPSSLPSWSSLPHKQFVPIAHLENAWSSPLPTLYPLRRAASARRLEGC
eukprot:scaffold102144_cov24-Tisochrysis_lutea.AAC.4